ncbi:MAG TPA: TonB-dependent receptor [Candidatus Elarobacter sp.]|nr:TonB-dependent receptor [Candidatus Elarobacter sp.]
MIHLVRAGAFAVLFGACAVAAAAQSPLPSPSPSPSAIPEIGRVVTSDRRPEAASNATRPTFVVDRATIDSFGSRTIGDALENVPGVGLFSYGAFGAQVNYGIRGTSSSETLILQDGVPIATASNGIVDLGELSTAGVQRIEVVESGASTLYGSSATGGVINIITALGAQPSLRIAAGSLGDRDVAAQFGTGTFAVSFERHLASNVYAYPALGYAGGNATPAGTRTNADAQQSAVRLSYLAQLGGGWTARLAAGDEAMQLGVPGSLQFLTADARQNTERSDALLDLSRALGRGTLDLTLSGSAQKLVYLDVPDLGGEDDTFDARTQASLRYTATGAHSDLVTGVDLSRETALLTFAPSTPPQSSVGVAEAQSAAYAQYGYDPSAALRVTFGLRAENDAPHGKVLAPSLGARMTFGDARLTANVGESYRVPTLIDLYYPGFSNPSLLPERLTNYDATLAFPSLGGGVSLGYFGRDGSNLIVLDPTTFAPFNASRASVNGLQLTAATRPLHHWRATAGITDVYRALDTSTGLRLPNTPPIVATVGLERAFDGGPFAAGVRVRVVGSSPDVPNYVGGPPYADPYDAYTSADAYVRYRVLPAAILTLRARNLGDERYAPLFGYPAPGRTFEVELATR